MKVIELKKADGINKYNGKILKHIKDKKLIEVWAKMDDGSEHIFKYLPDLSDKKLKELIIEKVKEHTVLIEE